MDQNLVFEFSGSSLMLQNTFCASVDAGSLGSGAHYPLMKDEVINLSLEVFS